MAAMGWGRLVRTAASASVPPVEAPIETIGSVLGIERLSEAARVSEIAGMTASAKCLASTTVFTSFRAPLRTLAWAAAFATSQMSMRESVRNCLVSTRGLVMTSTAPAASASIMTSECSLARLEQMTTGIGR